MSVWNTVVTVVVNVEAPSAEEAIRKLRRDVESKGYEVYDDGAWAPDSFEAESDTRADLA